MIYKPGLYVSVYKIGNVEIQTPSSLFYASSLAQKWEDIAHTRRSNGKIVHETSEEEGEAYQHPHLQAQLFASWFSTEDSR